MSSRTVLLLAGEASGDHHAAAVAASLRRLVPGVRLIGTGGSEMAAEGVELVAELDDLAVMGFAEVLPRIPYFWRLERRVIRLLTDAPIDLVVLVDYPGLNMRIARAAHQRGVKVLYYIAPQVWAWRTGRAKKLAAWTDRVAVILPFEVDFLGARGVEATFVGHPLLDRPDDVAERAEFFETWGLDPSRRLLAVLPGSRRQELARHLAPFTGAVQRVSAARPDVLPVFARAASLDARLLHETGFPTVDDPRGLLRHADVALVKSGTSTLEATVERTPHVIAYVASTPTWVIARRVVRSEHIGLPNLIAGERVVPEFVQDEVDPVRLSETLLQLLAEDGVERLRQLEGLDRIRAALGEPGAAERVARLGVELLGVDAA